ncbi:apoptosis-inducing factor 1, mitochondrial [Prorops nasuta]|uniref:apoptosis-inducing factor 1, mitochondrial n=1 Tax=Prorops nasuta TaxID=863751 RepID=UPI0034CDA4EA
MLSCYKIIGRLSPVIRLTYTSNFSRLLKNEETIRISSLRYKSNKDENRPIKPAGTTITPEECLPNAKTSKLEKKKLPACEAQANGTCPAPCYDDSTKSDTSKTSNSIFSTHSNKILAIVLFVGASLYMFTKYKQSKSHSSESTGCIKDLDKYKAPLKCPPKSKFIPKEIEYLLIGGGTASFSAFRAIKSTDSKAKVLVVTDEPNFPYMRPPLSKEIWFNDEKPTEDKLNFLQWNGKRRSIFYEPDEFYTSVEKLASSENGGVAVVRGWKITKLDVENKLAYLDDGSTIQYKKCLIATGASPKHLPLFDKADEKVKEKILYFRTKDDFIKLQKSILKRDVKNIIIIGGGFLGSELSCSLGQNVGEDQKVYQIFREKYVMDHFLPEYLSKWTTEKVKKEKVKVVPNTEVENFSMKDGRITLALSDNKSIEADQIIVAIGVKANTELAEESKLEVDPVIGGYLVNAELEARSGVWVAGDAACFYDVMLGRRRVEHHDHAVISGRLAGDNMTGAGLPYNYQSMIWSDLGPDVGYEAIGIIDSKLPTVGVFARPGTENTKSKDSVKESKDNRTQNESNASPVPENEDDQYKKGVIFYLKDDKVVGILLWNVFNRISIARRVLSRGTHYNEINEAAKLFELHYEPDESGEEESEK